MREITPRPTCRWFVDGVYMVSVDADGCRLFQNGTEVGAYTAEQFEAFTQAMVALNRSAQDAIRRLRRERLMAGMTRLELAICIAVGAMWIGWVLPVVLSAVFVR